MLPILPHNACRCKRPKQAHSAQSYTNIVLSKPVPDYFHRSRVFPHFSLYTCLFVRFAGKSENKGLPVLEQVRGHDS